MASHLLPATNVPFRCAGLAMSMKEEKAIRPALSAKPDSSASKERLSHFWLTSIGFSSNNFD
jgi:hypothetical protein